MPVVRGRPVAFVRTSDAGVPIANPVGSVALIEGTPTPEVTRTPLFAVAMLAGATPAPPPMTSPFAASTPDDAHAAAPEKYGMPPLVPATVSARVPVPVIGDPVTR